MKNAKDYMSEERFWEIMEHSDKGKNLKEELNKLSEDEIMGYWCWWRYFCSISYNQALWAVAWVVFGGCGDDKFDYFRFWLVTRGKKVFYDALANADSLCNEFEKLPEDEYPQGEDFDYVPIHVLDEKFGKDIYEEENKYEFDFQPFREIKFEWEEDDEDSIRKIVPNTFDRWWGNDVF